LAVYIIVSMRHGHTNIKYVRKVMVYVPTKGHISHFNELTFIAMKLKSSIKILYGHFSFFICKNIFRMHI